MNETSFTLQQLIKLLKQAKTNRSEKYAAQWLRETVQENPIGFLNMLLSEERPDE